MHPEIKIMLNFEQLGLSKPLTDHLLTLGYITPTPIQEKAVPLLLSKENDLVALAQTGTGKTAAFGLPLIELCDQLDKNTQALILAPTRELCVQITSDLENYCGVVKRLNITAVYGGASISEQIKKLRKGSQIVVATPGRLIDLLERKAVDLHNIKYFVLDEADEMLKMGFQEAIDTILSSTAEEKNVWLFSATMPPEISRISKKYMSNPVEITVGDKNQGNVNIKHLYTIINPRDRYAALKRLIDYHYDIYGVIFCRTKMETQEVADSLLADGYNADSLHGDLSQPQRDKVLNNFRNRSLQLLVATDVAARGIDIDDITHVIHFNLPDEIEYYTHRSGRTARAGKTGVSLALITSRETYRLAQIEKKIKASFERMMIPSGREICHRKMLGYIEQLNKVKINETEIEPFLPVLHDSLKDLTREEVIRLFASMEFNQFLDYYRNSLDINPMNERSGGRSRERDDDSRSFRRSGGVRLFINLGKMDNLDKKELLWFLQDETGVSKSQINDMDMKSSFSFFEVDSTLVADRLRKGVQGKWFEDRLVRIEVAENKEDGERKRRDDRGDFKRRDDRGSGSRDRFRDSDRDKGFKKKDDKKSFFKDDKKFKKK